MIRGGSTLARSLSANSTKALSTGKFGNLPSKDIPLDPKKHCYPYDPIPKPTTERLLAELNEKRWTMMKMKKQQKAQKEMK